MRAATAVRSVSLINAPRNVAVEAMGGRQYDIIQRFRTKKAFASRTLGVRKVNGSYSSPGQWRIRANARMEPEPSVCRGVMK